MAGKVAIVGTGLEKNVSREQLRAAGVIDERGNPVLDPARQLKTVEQGAATIVWCATSRRLADATRLTGVSPYAIDMAAAERLWRSVRLLGLGA